MIFLVDSCVWSLALRRNAGAALTIEEEWLKRQLRETIQNGQVGMIGPIRQELLSGLRDEAQFKRLREVLSAFPDELLASADYEEAARLFNLCGRRGIVGGPVDILICAVAWRRNWAVMTSDLGLKRCLEVADELGGAGAG
jgi:predicted nucleic acid-binding protein